MDQKLINEIRENIDIVEFVSKYIPLTKRGKNYFGVCPFHSDTNPSLCVSKDKQIFKCFVCGEAGNVFSFLMKYDKISFYEAVKEIGDGVGISVGHTDNYKKIDKYKDLYDIYDVANKFYQNNLLASEGSKARDYLEKRHLDMGTIKEFKIGLSLNKRDTLTKLLVKKGFDLSLLNDLGLSSNDYDTYINRIIFPLEDTKGKINGFSGRIYNGENTNKYLNTKETSIFKKGENIYNYHRSKEYVRKSDKVIVMEGFMAVIRAHTVGIKNCVALMGTAITTDQINLIKKLSNNIYLCFDGDNAGISATLNNGELFQKAGCNVKVIPLSNKLDPDDYILENGVERFNGLIENALNFIDYKIRALKKGINFNSIDEKTEYINKVIIEISLIKDTIKREIMLKELAKDTDVWYNTLEKKLNDLLSKQEKIMKKEVSSAVISKKPTKNKYEKTLETIIYYMLNKSEIITIVENSHIYFPIESYRLLANEISYYYNKYGIINMADFSSYLETKEELNSIFNDIISLDLGNDIDNNVILEYLDVIKDYNVALEIKRLEKLIINEVDPIVQAEIGNRIMKLKIGSEEND